MVVGSLGWNSSLTISLSSVFLKELHESQKQQISHTDANHLASWSHSINVGKSEADKSWKCVRCGSFQAATSHISKCPIVQLQRKWLKYKA